MAKKFSETRVGKFLATVAPSALSVIGDVFPPAQLVASLFEDKKPDRTPEQITEFNVLLAEYEANELKAYMADIADARAMNVQVQQAERASWLSKNVAFILDLSVMGAVIGLGLLLYFVQIPVGNKEIAYSLLGVLFASATQILSFHRGSSKGSADKTDILIKSLNDKK